MRAWEQASWAVGRSEEAVMRAAGHAVAEAARRFAGPDASILVLAGKGHNGDDVRFAAAELSPDKVRIVNVTEPVAAAAEVRELLVTTRPSLIIDGLFGIGLNRPLDETWRVLVELVNASNVPVLAVDVPSGLDADTGEPMGAAIRATVTVTFGAPKMGLVRLSSPGFVGRLEVATKIGLIECPHRAELNWTLPEDFIGFPPPRPLASHKGTYGHLGIIAGSLGYHGAALLAMRGALRAHPGLVTLHVAENVYGPVAAQTQAAMVRPWLPGEWELDDYSAVLAGPGLASRDLPPSLGEAVLRAWRHSTKLVVVDASALDWLPAGATHEGAARVITPHPGEAARLLGTTIASVQADRASALRELSRKFGGCWVVLKGHQTLVGRSKGDLFINPSGNPRLAQGGSGDVLAGYVAGLLAQPRLQSDPLAALRFAVWQHGAAADYLERGRRAWGVEDLAVELGAAR
ncbi:MAG: NAD(P)H-hydrate dehydratase [Pedosphaera sp.]|nr:NAD(P)H-hydrate dehydratase [Pedosphaera sp.]